MLVRTLTGRRWPRRRRWRARRPRHRPLLPRAAGRRRARAGASCARRCGPRRTRRTCSRAARRSARGARPLAARWARPMPVRPRRRWPAPRPAWGAPHEAGSTSRAARSATSGCRDLLFAVAAVVVGVLTVRHAFLDARPAARRAPRPLHHEVAAPGDGGGASSAPSRRSMRGVAPEPKALARWLVVKEPGGPPRLLLDEPVRAPRGGAPGRRAPRLDRAQRAARARSRLDVEAVVRSPRSGLGVRADARGAAATSRTSSRRARRAAGRVPLHDALPAAAASRRPRSRLRSRPPTPREAGLGAVGSAAAGGTADETPLAPRRLKLPLLVLVGPERRRCSSPTRCRARCGSAASPPGPSCCATRSSGSARVVRRRCGTAPTP